MTASPTTVHDPDPRATRAPALRSRCSRAIALAALVLSACSSGPEGFCDFPVDYTFRNEQLQVRGGVEVTRTFGVRWKDDIWLVVLISPQEGPHRTGVWVTDINPLREPGAADRPTILPLTEDAAYFTDVMQIGDFERLRGVYEVAGDKAAVPFADACGRALVE